MQETITRTETYTPTESGPIIETKRVVVITEEDRAFMRAMRAGMTVCFLAMLVAAVLEYLILFGVVP